MSSADLDAVTCLFLDTERADAAGVSLALASEDGVHWFYAERDPLPAMSTEFFRDVAYPILDCGPVAMSNQAMATRLRSFLCVADTPVVLAG